MPPYGSPASHISEMACSYLYGLTRSRQMQAMSIRKRLSPASQLNPQRHGLSKRRWFCRGPSLQEAALLPLCRYAAPGSVLVNLYSSSMVVGMLVTWLCLVYISHVYLNQSIQPATKTAIVFRLRRLWSSMISIFCMGSTGFCVLFPWIYIWSSIMPEMASSWTSTIRFNGSIAPKHSVQQI